jgi:putative phosphoribosyl transferase
MHDLYDRSMRKFIDRKDGGCRLGARLAGVLGDTRAVVVGLARGGVPVAYEVARVLHCPLDVLVVRKVGLPSYPEFAMGAIGEDGVVVVEHDTVESLGVSAAQFARAVADERAELERRIRLYRQGESPIDLEGKVVIIVDDGLATGATARAACEVARARGAERVIVAVPVTSVEAERRIDRVADRTVFLVRAGGPFAVGEWYENFEQTSDEEVIDDLAKARRAQLASAAPKSTPPRGGWVS